MDSRGAAGRRFFPRPAAEDGAERLYAYRDRDQESDRRDSLEVDSGRARSAIELRVVC